MRLVAYDSCDGLLDGLRKATEKQVGPYGLGGGRLLQGKVPDGDIGAMGAPEARGMAKAQAPDHSGTNAHEAGADEPDMVKTDGRRIVVLARGALQILDPATRKVTHRLKLPDTFAGASQLLLAGDRALILNGQSMVPLEDTVRPRGPYGDQMGLLMVDLAGAPRILGSMTGQSAFVDARQSGSVARIVVRSTPRIEFPQPDKPVWPDRTATERNREIVRKAPLDAWLPRFTVRDGTAKTGGRGFSVPCERVSSPADGAGSSLVSVLTVDLAKGLADPATVSVAADGQTVYGTGSSLYVTGSHGWGDMEKPVRAGDQRTDVHQFDVTGSGLPRYMASGSVSGSLLNQYSLSEHGGDLRVATTNTPEWEPTPGPGQRSQSSVHVLRRNGARLEPVGRVDGLGKGERIYAVRFIGPAAYVVTFRQVDPLYVVDLRDPARPRVTGELKITGYSAYLHPTADGRLLGVGQEADKAGRTLGTQVSLFDVSGAPRRVGAHRLADSSSETEFDPHAFLYWPKSGLTVIPVMRQRGERTEALVFTAGPGGLRRLGSVRHPGGGDYSPIRRSLIVGDTLWTVSDSGARASDARTLADQGWLAF